MGHHVLTLNIPDPLYHQLKDCADKSHRTVESETLAVLTSTVPVSLPAELEEAVAALSLLDDAALWRAARASLAPDVAVQMENLHDKTREGLTEAESQVLDTLV